MEYIVITINEQGVALLELNRPRILNVLNAQLMEEMSCALRELADDESVRALIVTGRGRGFCAGADLSHVSTDNAAGQTLGQAISRQMRDYFNPLMVLLYEFPRPVVSALNGIAAGGGAGIALCADIVLASSDASLKVVQVPKLGIVADLGVNWLLPRLGGRSRALGACLTGKAIDASQLLEWGLVWECIEAASLLERAHALAAELALLPPDTVIATRQLIDSAYDSNFVAALEAERVHQEKLCDAPVFNESVQRFLAR